MLEVRKTKALVIGGTGFIGSNLVRYLVRTGTDVVVYHRHDSDLRNLQDIRFTSVIGTLADEATRYETLRQAVKGCDVVYNLAACGTSLRKHQRLREIINVEAVATIARVVKEAKTMRLVQISSSAAVGFPDSPVVADENFKFNGDVNHYAVTKRQGEAIIQAEVENGLDGVIAIPCSTVGAIGMKAHQYNLFKGIAAGKIKVYPPGGLCLTDVKDLVCGIVLCFERGRPGRRYILGGTNILYRDYFGEIARSTGGRIPWIRLPKMLLPLLSLGVEMISDLAGRENMIDRHVGAMITRNLYYSSRRAIEELGYTITDWRQTIRDVVDEMRRKGVL